MLRLLFVVAERSALFCSVLLRPTNKPPVTAADPIRGPLCLSPRNSDHALPQTVGFGLDQIAADASCDKARLTPSDSKATSHCAHFLRFFFSRRSSKNTGSCTQETRRGSGGECGAESRVRFKVRLLPFGKANRRREAITGNKFL